MISRTAIGAATEATSGGLTVTGNIGMATVTVEILHLMV